MKWGIRRYQNPDGTLTALGKKRAKSNTAKRALVRDYLKTEIKNVNELNKNNPNDDDATDIKSGGKTYHITPNDFKSLKEGQQLYVSANDYDRNTYKVFLTLMMKRKGYGIKTPIKEVELTLKKDLKAPSNNEQRNIFENTYNNNKSVFEKDLKKYYSKNPEKRPKDNYEAFIKSLDAPSQKSKDIFYKEMKNLGYTAVLDQHDVDHSWMFAKKPLIVMDALNTFGDIKVKDISDQDILNSLKSLKLI